MRIAHQRLNQIAWSSSDELLAGDGPPTTSFASAGLMDAEASVRDFLIPGLLPLFCRRGSAVGGFFYDGTMAKGEG